MNSIEEPTPGRFRRVNAVIPHLSGNDWQEWANRLLTCHYGPTDYQRIPDNDRGDAGLEGFARGTGHAYQAYGCDEPVSAGVRYERQRDKMTEDISKFINNRAILQRLLGPVQITRWSLFVPHFDSREIVAHAARKTTEVVSANLPYVSPTFQVHVCDEADFTTERNRLLNENARPLRIAAAEPTEEERAQWAATNQGLARTLAQKLNRLPTLQSETRRHLYHSAVLDWYLKGQEILDDLRQYPEVYEKVRLAKSHRE